MSGTSNGAGVDMTLNPTVAGLKPSKTMHLSDLAASMREAGQDIISLAAGEPDFDTPQAVLDAGIEALRSSAPHNDVASPQDTRHSDTIIFLPACGCQPCV